MKLTNIQKSTRKAGMTLLELTVVILVLLSLISILFIGARAWKKGSDRAASILQIRNVQQAVRSQANMGELKEGDPVAKTDIFGPGKFIEKLWADVEKSHPAGAGANAAVANQTYKFAIANDTVPAMGTLYMKTGGTAPANGELITYYDPSNYSDW